MAFKGYIESVESAFCTSRRVPVFYTKTSILEALGTLPDTFADIRKIPKRGTGQYNDLDSIYIEIGDAQSQGHLATNYITENIRANKFEFLPYLMPGTNKPSYRFELGADENNAPCYWLYVCFKIIDGKYKLFWSPTQYNDVDHTYYDPSGATASDTRTGAWYNNYKEFPVEEFPAVSLLILEDDSLDNDGGLYISVISPEFENFYRFQPVRISDFPFEIQSIEVDVEDDRYGSDSEEEGYPIDDVDAPGRWDDSSDTITTDPMPDVSVSDMGFLNVYKVTKSSLTGLLEEIYPDLEPIPDPTDINEGIIWLGKQVERLTANFLNSGLQKYIVDAHVIPCDIPGGTSEAIQVGFRTTSKTGKRLSSDYVDVNCGSVTIPQFFYNFLDFNTDISLYLPFVGFVPVPTELVLGGSVTVSYRFNVLDGSFVCTVKSTSKFSKLSESQIATYSGCCCVHMPLTSSDYSNIVSGIVGTVGSVNSGNISAMTSSVLNLAQNVTSGGGFSMSNGYNASSGFLGKRTPYLLIGRPVRSFSGSYPHEKGFPLNVQKRLGELSGFTVCEAPHLDGLHATESEKKAIYNLLTSGVIL